MYRGMHGHCEWPEWVITRRNDQCFIEPAYYQFMENNLPLDKPRLRLTIISSEKHHCSDGKYTGPLVTPHL